MNTMRSKNMICLKKYVVISDKEVIKMGRLQSFCSGAAILASMNARLVLTAFFMCLFGGLAAQTTLISDDPRVEQRLRTVQSQEGTAIIIQQGLDNDASLNINARSQDAMEVQLQQSGTGNSADIDLNSSAGELNVIQEGNFNSTELDNVRFNESQLNVIQVGEDHTVTQRDVDIQSSTTEIYQEGTNHTIEIESNLEIEGMRISQYGNGANIRISNQ